jgi:DNA-binding transcriptional LysR family regulator
VERQNINDLMVFLVVARERSFTRAAAKFGVSQSALSHTIRQLEARLGVRLLTRTTRSVSPTEAGERMLRSIGPLFDEIGSAIDGLNTLREKPAGTIRLTAGDYQIQYYIWPKLRTFLHQYPDIRVELDVNSDLPVPIRNASHWRQERPCSAGSTGGLISCVAPALGQKSEHQPASDA